MADIFSGLCAGLIESSGHGWCDSGRPLMAGGRGGCCCFGTGAVGGAQVGDASVPPIPVKSGVIDREELPTGIYRLEPLPVPESFWNGLSTFGFCEWQCRPPEWEEHAKRLQQQVPQELEGLYPKDAWTAFIAQINQVQCFECPCLPCFFLTGPFAFCLMGCGYYRRWSHERTLMAAENESLAYEGLAWDLDEKLLYWTPARPAYEQARVYARKVSQERPNQPRVVSPSVVPVGPFFAQQQPSMPQQSPQHNQFQAAPGGPIVQSMNDPNMVVHPRFIEEANSMDRVLPPPYSVAAASNAPPAYHSPYPAPVYGNVSHPFYVPQSLNPPLSAGGVVPAGGAEGSIPCPHCSAREADPNVVFCKFCGHRR